jgi:tetratricopeptide (TPR) repeat protein
VEVHLTEKLKAALITFNLKESATLSEIRAEYLDLTSQNKFQRILGPDEEDLQKEFSKIYQAYATLTKEYSQQGDSDDMEYYPPNQVFQFHFNQGVFLFIHQKYIEAGERFQHAFKMDNRNNLLLLYLGVLLLKRKNYYAAEKYFKDAIKFDRNNDDAWFYLGESYFKAGELRKALSMYETARSLSPGRNEIAYRIKEIKEKLGEKTSRSKKSFFSRLIKKLSGDS